MNAARALPILLGCLLAAVSLLAPAGSQAAGVLCDPVVTYTNGMRLASTTALRSHNVYWQCDRGHVGYCDGRSYTPCRNALRELGTRPHGRFVPPYTGPGGSTSPMTTHSHDGFEPTTSETLGVLTVGEGAAAPLGQRGEAGPVAPIAPPVEGGALFDTLQTIGRKMMAGEG